MVADVLPFRANRSRRAPVVIEVDRAEIVGRHMEYQSRVAAALDENGAAWNYAARAAQDPTFAAGAFEACRMLREQQRTLTELLVDLKSLTGELDGFDGNAA